MDGFARLVDEGGQDGGDDIKTGDDPDDPGGAKGSDEESDDGRADEYGKTCAEIEYGHGGALICRYQRWRQGAQWYKARQQRSPETPREEGRPVIVGEEHGRIIEQQ